MQILIITLAVTLFSARAQGAPRMCSSTFSRTQKRQLHYILFAKGNKKKNKPLEQKSKAHLGISRHA